MNRNRELVYVRMPQAISELFATMESTADPYNLTYSYPGYSRYSQLSSGSSRGAKFCV
jgi:hypothetical protein